MSDAISYIDTIRFDLIRSHKQGHGDDDSDKNKMYLPKIISFDDETEEITQKIIKVKSVLVE